MLKNYFKIAWRNLVKSKGYSSINIGGLAVGMAVAILIGLWMYDELTFNSYHENEPRIARVRQRATFNGESFSHTAMPRPLEFVLRDKYGDNFKHLAMSFWQGDHVLS